MIIFKYVYYKNFLSTGNHGIKIDLDKSQTTMIVGSNGSGKSSFMDAITFCLFGKSYRGIPKPKLLNSINGRDLYTEVAFDHGKDSYVIKRGVKPDFFTIEKNGVKLDQQASARDQQKYLEAHILKTSFKAFCQVTLLGSAAYVPFMQLNAHARRQVIEQLLDIGVFSDMHRHLKGRQSALKESLTSLNEEIGITESQIKMQMDFMEKMKKSSRDGVAKQVDDLKTLKSKIETNVEERKRIESEIEEKDKEIQELVDGATKNIEDRVEETKDQLNQANVKFKKVNKDIKFFEENSSCVMCNQEISEDHRELQIGDLRSEQDRLNKKYDEQKEQYDQLSALRKKLTEVRSDRNELQHQLDLLKANINNQVQQAKKLKQEIESNNKEGDTTIEKEKETLLGYKAQLETYQEQKKDLLSRKEVLDFQQKLLKDDGIKSKIIKQYIPIINKNVNKYLTTMNFFVKFNLDENFNETLKSRHRDEFTYNNFSMGERQRIDLALLFAWREVAKMKNSVNCNILIFDEIFDSSLDQEGTEDLLSILQTLDPKIRVFVISHKNLMEDKFRSVINFEKQKDFSVIA